MKSKSTLQTRKLVINLRRFSFSLSLLLLATLCGGGFSAAQAPNMADAQKNIEAFLRNYFALGPEYKITISAPKELGNSGLFEVPIEVKSESGGDNIKMYLTRDGRYLLRGEINDLTVDALAANISKMKLEGAPVLGDPNAPITVVEYSDFECPVCRGLHDALTPK
jgi:protein-disulfide isomerase